jgi:hypothetical protein
VAPVFMPISIEAHTHRTSAGDSGRPRSEIGGGEGTAEESPATGRVMDETDYFRLGDHSPRMHRSSLRSPQYGKTRQKVDVPQW